MIRTIPVCLLLFLLAGCAAQLAARDDEACRSYGAAPGSQIYVQCRMHRAQLRNDMATAIAASPDPTVVVPGR